MTEWEAEAAAALRRVARDQVIKSWMLGSAPVRAALLRAARRFIGGETLAECLRTAQAINGAGSAVTIDYMGEETREPAAIRQAVDAFGRVVHAIQSEHLDASISLDLSHVGLAVDRDLALHNAATLAEAARAAGIEMMISMESSERTTEILELHGRLCERFDNVGITLQAYLYRTPEDLSAVLRRPGRIRLVKGAYAEPVEVARPRGAELDAAYRELMERLLASGHRCSIATHDSAMLDHAHAFVRALGLQVDAIEFETLYGVAPERLRTMRDLGYRTRVYLPYGEGWYLYVCHRLAEYPPNLYRALAGAAAAQRA